MAVNLDSLLDFDVGEPKAVATPLPEAADLRIRQLSYSGLNSLHSCPRRFELARKSATSHGVLDAEQQLTFDFGHAVGYGVQMCLEGKSQDETVFGMFCKWTQDLLFDSDTNKKSFWAACIAVRKFFALREQGYLKGWNLYYHNGKPATELSFAIHLPNEFCYRGFVDVVLVHEKTGKVLVVECKTTGASSPNPAMYRNSAQAIGYSIVLDSLFPELSEYSVLYQVYGSKTEEWEAFTFPKSFTQRAVWLQSLVMDAEIIEMYESSGVFPPNGNNCFSYNRECYYFTQCEMSTALLTKPFTDQMQSDILAERQTYQIQVTIQDLIESQVNRSV
jgi:hypothetical protein